ncbi:MAG: hypothetical protein RR232_04065 [Clostridia bacterium]
MREDKRSVIPVPDINGDAGTNTPLNRETRYRGYSERLHQHKEEIEDEQQAKNT